MTDRASGGWRAFWMPFTAGGGLVACMAAPTSRLAAPVSPLGILDHQAAGTAARVDEIQSAWAQAGTLGFAQTSMTLDLVFIGLVTLGALIGCAMIARRAPVPALRVFALVTGAIWVVYGVSDYVETIAQVLQAHSAGADQLAGVAAAMGLPKTITFLLGTLDLLAGLVWLRFASAKATLPV